MADILELPEILGFEEENGPLPSQASVNFWRLANERIFYVADEMDMDCLEIEKAIIHINICDKDIPVEERKPIKIFIDSPGGYLTEAMSLCSVVMMSKTPVITVNIGDAMSAACYLLIAGHKRYCLPFSTALIHTGSTSGGGGTFEQTQEAAKNYKKQIDKTSEYVLERTTISPATYKKNKNKDWYLTAEEQIQYGIVDAIVDDLDMIL